VNSENSKPLAERMRPTKLSDFIGQKHLVGENSSLVKSLQKGLIPSMIMWGPPGVGKTTLARLIANYAPTRPYYSLSAIQAGVKEVREILDRAGKTNLFENKKPIVFIDEIHRFNKAQQDSLLGAVENGNITLIGATTENPSFEVISALLSRCQVYVLKALEREELEFLLKRAIKEDDSIAVLKPKLKETEALLRFSGGDARKLLNALEIVCNASQDKNPIITNEKVQDIIQNNVSLYDKSGEQHYDIISAFIKSIRGSDPNAAVYWLARMIEGGEDPKFIARRMLIAASEDIGNANPTALALATSCFQAVEMIGYPECEIILSQTVVYLACSPKSNASYKAIKAAKQVVKNTGNLPVPLHLRNAPTNLMKSLGYGKDYKYPHDFENNFKNQEYMPEQLSKTSLYVPGKNARENEMKNYLSKLWSDKYAL
jgi:putative ATPase